MPKFVLESLDRPESQEVDKLSKARESLKTETIGGLERNRCYLQENGNFPKNSRGEVMNIYELVVHVTTCFNELHKKLAVSPLANIYGTPEYRAVVKLLVLSGVAAPIVLGDWEVDRTEADVAATFRL